MYCGGEWINRSSLNCGLKNSNSAKKSTRGLCPTQEKSCETNRRVLGTNEALWTKQNSSQLQRLWWDPKEDSCEWLLAQIYHYTMEYNRRKGLVSCYKWWWFCILIKTIFTFLLAFNTINQARLCWKQLCVLWALGVKFNNSNYNTKTTTIDIIILVLISNLVSLCIIFFLHLQTVLIK